MKMPSSIELEIERRNTADSIMELEAEITARNAALISAQSALSYVYHREQSKLSTETQEQIYTALCDVERITRSIK